MKHGNYLGKLKDYYLLRKYFFPWTYYVHKLVILSCMCWESDLYNRSRMTCLRTHSTGRVA